MDDNLNEPITFGYPMRMRLGIAVGALLLFPMLLLVLNTPDETRLLLLAFTLLMAGTVAWKFIRLGDRVTLDAQGVRLDRWLGGETSLAWVDMILHNRRAYNRLALCDSMGQNKITLEPGIDGFPRLLERVRQRRPDLWRLGPGEEYHQRNLMMLQVLLFAALMIVAVFGVVLWSSAAVMGSSIIGYILVLLLILGIFGYQMFTIPLEVSLIEDKLFLRYLGRERRHTINEIADVRLTVIYTGRNGYRTVIEIMLRQEDRLLRLQDIVGGTKLYCVLRTWWEDHQCN